jgi:hypothetical protein
LTMEDVWPCPSRAGDRAETRYGGAVDVKRAADLYARGRTLRQIGAKLGVHWSRCFQVAFMTVRWFRADDRGKLVEITRERFRS